MFAGVDIWHIFLQHSKLSKASFNTTLGTFDFVYTHCTWPYGALLGLAHRSYLLQKTWFHLEMSSEVFIIHLCHYADGIQLYIVFTSEQLKLPRIQCIVSSLSAASHAVA